MWDRVAMGDWYAPHLRPACVPTTLPRCIVENCLTTGVCPPRPPPPSPPPLLPTALLPPPSEPPRMADSSLMPPPSSLTAAASLDLRIVGTGVFVGLLFIGLLAALSLYTGHRKSAKPGPSSSVQIVDATEHEVSAPTRPTRVLDPEVQSSASASTLINRL